MTKFYEFNQYYSTASFIANDATEAVTRMVDRSGKYNNHSIEGKISRLEDKVVTLTDIVGKLLDALHHSPINDEIMERILDHNFELKKD